MVPPILGRPLLRHRSSFTRVRTAPRREPFNNSKQNLAYGSDSENMLDIPREIRKATGQKANAAASAANRLLTEKQEDSLRELRASTGAAYHHIGKIFGVSYDTARRVCVGRKRQREENKLWVKPS